jgi:elongation of very long chain fatty acids protein 6
MRATWEIETLKASMRNYSREDVVPRYGMVFPFEASFDPVPAQQFFYGHRITTIWLSAAYVATVFGAQHWMKSKKEFSLRGGLVIWNALLAIFSLIGTFRSLPELTHVVTQKGFGYSVCIPRSVSYFFI